MSQQSFIDFVVVGMRFREGGVEAKDVLDYDFLRLVPEPDNPHDRGAVRVDGVAAASGDVALGYVSRGSCAGLGTRLPPTGGVVKVHTSRLDGPFAVRVIAQGAFMA